MGPELQQAYDSGRGQVTLRAKAAVEVRAGKGGDRERIVITELPYQVAKVGGGGGGNGIKAGSGWVGRRNVVSSTAAVQRVHASVSLHQPCTLPSTTHATERSSPTPQADLISTIAAMVTDKERCRELGLEGVADVRDESDRSGLKVVVELRRGAGAEDTLARLFKHTRLQVGGWWGQGPGL